MLGSWLAFIGIIVSIYIFQQTKRQERINHIREKILNELEALAHFKCKYPSASDNELEYLSALYRIDFYIETLNKIFKNDTDALKLKDLKTLFIFDVNSLKDEKGNKLNRNQLMRPCYEAIDEINKYLISVQNHSFSLDKVIPMRSFISSLVTKCAELAIIIALGLGIYIYCGWNNKIQSQYKLVSLIQLQESIIESYNTLDTDLTQVKKIKTTISGDIPTKNLSNIINSTSNEAFIVDNLLTDMKNSLEKIVIENNIEQEKIKEVEANFIVINKYISKIN